MKRLLALIAISLPVWAQTGNFPPSAGGGVGVGAANVPATAAGPVTSLAITITTLNLTSINVALIQCWSGTTTRTPLAITNYTTTGTNPITTVTPTFSSSSNVICVVNSNGGAGATGATGAAGANGSNGTNGSTLLNGTGAPSNGSGANGDYYLNNTNTCLYGPKSAGAWPGSCTSLVGPTGATGAAGSNGTNGTNGTNGAISRIYNSGSALPVEPFLNFVNGGCVDNSGSTRTDCTVSGGGGTPGGSNNSLQTKNGSSFGGDTHLTYDGIHTLISGATTMSEGLAVPTIDSSVWRSDGTGFVIGTGSAVYTDDGSTHFDEVFQFIDDMILPMIPGVSYTVTYTIGSVSGSPPACATSATYTSGTALPLTMTVGAHPVTFTYNGGGFFDIECTSTSGQTVAFTHFSLPVAIPITLDVTVDDSVTTAGTITNHLTANDTTNVAGFNSYINRTGYATRLFGPGGNSQTLVEPAATACNSGFGNLQTGFCFKTYHSGLANPASYGNMSGLYLATHFYNSRNSYDNSDKKTMQGFGINHNARGSGQQFGLNVSSFYNGAGDMFGISNQVTADGWQTAQGDEGISMQWNAIEQAANLLKFLLISSTATTCNTSITSAVTKSNDPLDIQTVPVTSTTGCSVGDWVTVDPGPLETWFLGSVSTVGTAVTWVSGNKFDPSMVGNNIYIDNFGYNVSVFTDDTHITLSTSAGTQTNNYVFGDVFVEVVQLTAVGTGTISALFQSAHGSNAKVGPSSILAGDEVPMNGSGDNQVGTDRIIVNLTYASPKTSGTITSIGEVTLGNGKIVSSIVGSGTGWSTNMVGGDTNWVGCIAFTDNNVAYAPFDGGRGPLVSWYPIFQVASGTTLYLSRKYTGTDPTITGAYTIRPCSWTQILTVDGDADGETITGFAIRGNTFTWSVDDNVEFTISPYSTIAHGILCTMYWYGPRTSNLSSCFEAANNGHIMEYAATRVPMGSFNQDPHHANWQFGLSLESNMGQAGIQFLGRSLTGNAINLIVKPAGTDDGGAYPVDLKAINWGAGNDSCAISPHGYNTGTGFQILCNVNKLNLVNGSNPAQSVIIDATGVTTNRTVKIPDKDGTMLLDTLFGPGNLTLTHALGGAADDWVEIGDFQNGSALGYLIVIGAGEALSKAYVFSGASANSSNWWKVNPTATSVATYGDTTTNFDLEIKTTGAPRTYLRARQTAGTGTTALKISIYQFGRTDATWSETNGSGTASGVLDTWPGSSLLNPSLGTGASSISRTATAGVGGVTAKYLAAKDASDPTRRVLPASGGCGGGIAATTATVGNTFEMYVMGGSVITGVADNAVTAGHVLVGGTATPGRVRDSGQTSRTAVDSATCIVGIALAGATTGADALFEYDGPGTYGTSISAASLPAITFPAAGTSVTLVAPAEFFECSSTCTITMPVPAAGYQFCVRNASTVATVITFAAIGSSARYENTNPTLGYGTAGTGTAVSGGTAGDRICFVGRDSTHYDVFSFGGIWTMN